MDNVIIMSEAAIIIIIAALLIIYISTEEPEWRKRFGNKNKKEEIWLSPMTKAPTPTEMSKGQSDNTNNATKKFD